MSLNPIPNQIILLLLESYNLGANINLAILMSLIWNDLFLLFLSVRNIIVFFGPSPTLTKPLRL
ncbi:protein of unknown function [Limnospira indica PCC 8005]|uniref:Uncharacterized protein n=1 Tax=Limnospira indica PCC 8005 TaxID=376219 RepID=A0A9P1KCJ3_9CYAN|nr:protein of unknown function [Limnospira indica PCC 8005]